MSYYGVVVGAWDSYVGYCGVMVGVWDFYVGYSVGECVLRPVWNFCVFDCFGH